MEDSIDKISLKDLILAYLIREIEKEEKKWFANFQSLM
jgi:hypothetical protein